MASKGDDVEYQRNPSFFASDDGGGQYAPVAPQYIYQQQPQGYASAGYAGTAYPTAQGFPAHNLPQQQQQYYAGQAPQVQVHHQICVEYEDDDRLRCARVGCLFSWIPLFGLINFIMNISAPVGSLRRQYAWRSLLVAGFVIILNFAAFFVYFWLLGANRMNFE